MTLGNVVFVIAERDDDADIAGRRIEFAGGGGAEAIELEMRCCRQPGAMASLLSDTIGVIACSLPEDGLAAS